MSKTKTKRTKTTKVRPVNHTVLILDQSGSMANDVDFAVANYNEQVQQAQRNSIDQDIFVGLITFSGGVYDFEHLWKVPATELKQSTEEDYVCCGATRLNDALGYAIQKLKATVKDDDNTSYLIKVITDGEENDSKVWPKWTPKAKELHSMIKACQETGRWTFTFMGCSPHYMAELAMDLGVAAGNMAAMSMSNKGSATGSGTVGTVNYYREVAKGGARGMSATPYFGGLVNTYIPEGYVKTSGGILDVGTTPTCVMNDTVAKISDTVPAPNDNIVKALNMPKTNVFKEARPVTWQVQTEQ